MATESFQYATLRVVPRVEREEFLNVGVIVFCRTRGYLAARAELDPERLRALDPAADVDAIRDQLDAVVRIAAGDADAGPVAALPQSERFHWLVAPSSTVVQTSASHGGVCDDPAGLLQRLFTKLVA